MSTVTQRLGKRIRQLRQMRDMTQEQLSEAADISISFLGGIERGAKSPTVETLQKLADALDMTLPELLSFDSGVKVVEDQKAAQLRRLLSEFADRIETMYKE